MVLVTASVVPPAGVKAMATFTVTSPFFFRAFSCLPLAATVTFTGPAAAGCLVTVFTPLPESFSLPGPGTLTVRVAVPLPGFFFGFPGFGLPELPPGGVEPVRPPVY